MRTDQESLSGTQPIEIYSVNDKLPRWGQCVIVVTPYYHCRGFLGPDGEWRDTGDGTLIENVQSWCLIDADQSKTARGADIFGE